MNTAIGVTWGIGANIKMQKLFRHSLWFRVIWMNSMLTSLLINTCTSKRHRFDAPRRVRYRIDAVPRMFAIFRRISATLASSHEQGPNEGVLRNTIEHIFNALRPRQNGRHFADDTFKRIFLEENVRISIKISLKFVPKSPIDNIHALFQIMAWRRPGDKPLSEAMMVSLLAHICVARPQWVNTLAHLKCAQMCWTVHKWCSKCVPIWRCI